MKTIAPVAAAKICAVDFCERDTGRHSTMCGGHRSQKRRGRELTVIEDRTPKSAASRLSSKVQVREGCWGWSGAIDDAGYGVIGETVDGKWRTLKAHRVSYELHAGAIPAGSFIDHICHNRSCTNPDHLRLASNKQNQENRAGANLNSKSGVRGVYWDSKRGKWVGEVTHDGIVHFVGHFASLMPAEQAVSQKRRELFTHSAMDAPSANPG